MEVRAVRQASNSVSLVMLSQPDSMLSSRILHQHRLQMHLQPVPARQLPPAHLEMVTLVPKLGLEWGCFGCGHTWNSYLEGVEEIEAG